MQVLEKIGRAGILIGERLSQYREIARALEFLSLSPSRLLSPYPPPSLPPSPLPPKPPSILRYSHPLFHIFSTDFNRRTSADCVLLQNQKEKRGGYIGRVKFLFLVSSRSRQICVFFFLKPV